MSKERGNTLIANNKKAYHEYFIEEKFEAGIELVGTEVKSIRQGHCSIKEAFVGIDHGEVYVYRMNVNPYERIRSEHANSCCIGTRSINS
mgnify:CR=1 FL=1